MYRVFRTFGTGFLGVLGGERTGYLTRAQRGMDYAYVDVPPLRSVAGRVAADVAAGLEWRLYRVPGGAAGASGKSSRAKLRSLATLDRNRAIRAMIDKDEAVEVVDHPVLTMLRTYNEVFGPTQSEQFIQLCVDLHGSSFVLIRRELGVIVELLPVHPGSVTKQSKRDEYRVRLEDNVTETVKKADLIHIRDINPGNPFGLGSGTAGALRDELSAYELAILAELSYYRNNASPELIAMVEGASEDEIDFLEAQWEDRYRGAEKSGKTAWMNRKIEFHERKSDFGRARSGEHKTWHKDMATETFGVPPGVLGRNVNENRATLTQATKIYTAHVLLPRMDRICDAYVRNLLPAFVNADDLVLTFDPPEVMDYDYILDVSKAAPWVITKNQWLGLAGLPEVDDGNIIAVPTNVRLIDLDTMTEILPAAGGESDDGAEPPDDEDDEDAKGVEDTAETRAVGPTGVAPTSRSVSIARGDIEPVLASIDSQYLVDETGEDYVRTIASYGEATLDELVGDRPFNSRSDRIARYLDNRKLKLVKGVNEETKKQLRAILDEGVENGWSIDKTKRAIRRKFIDMRAYRAAAIARTETIGAANFAIYEAQIQSGVVKRRKWLAGQDGRTRETHAKMHNQEQPIDSMFESPSGATAVAPGQFGVAAEDVNCRCTTVAVITDDDLQIELGGPEHIAIMRTFDDRAKPRERAFKAAVRRAFSKQQTDLIDRLDALVPSEAA